MSDINDQTTNPDDVIKETQKDSPPEIIQNNPSEKFESIMRLENLINGNLMDLEHCNQASKSKMPC